MSVPYTDDPFAKALKALEEENYVSALSFLEQAYAREPSPTIGSHLAVCIARERGLVKKALEICKDAMDKEPSNSVHYLNLGRVLLLAKRREEAVDMLRKGMAIEPNPLIVRELERLGIRKRPPVPFISRKSPINRYLGIILKKLQLR